MTENIIERVVVVMKPQNKERLKELLELKERRLHELEKRQSIEGIYTPPQIIIEIEDIKREISTMRDDLSISTAVTNVSTFNPINTLKSINDRIPWIIICIFLLLISGIALFIIQLYTTGNREETFSVFASVSPPAPTKTLIQAGDHVEISVNESERWSCIGEEQLDSRGTDKYPDTQVALTSRSANFCSLIGYIGNGPILSIGENPIFTATTSGQLYLGVNDTPSERCNFPIRTQCYGDNKGSITVKIKVTRASR